MSGVDLGDPMDDLSVATVLMMVGGQLVLLRPRKVCIRIFSLLNLKLDPLLLLVGHPRSPL